MKNDNFHENLKKERIIIQFLNNKKELLNEILNRQNNKGERLALVFKVQKNKNNFNVKNVFYLIEEQIKNKNIQLEVKKYDISNQLVVIIIQENKDKQKSENINLITLNFFPQIISGI